MATYAIGDVQGCFTQLQRLLDVIRFDPSCDYLWFAGDLVNRGPDSLATLRFVKALGDRQITVLCNHDLNCLAVSEGVYLQKKGDTLDDLLQAEDALELLNWLRTRPLLHADDNIVLTHAGLAPQWDLPTAKRLAGEVEAVLQSPLMKSFLAAMYGSEPSLWDESLVGMDRLRCITNYFTRMRFCYADGRLDLQFKGEVGKQPPTLYPWFLVPNRANAELTLIFGHWAALNGKTNLPNVIGLDTGCVWGNCLTALRLDDRQYFQVRC